MPITLKAARINTGLSQAEAGEKIGVSPNVISNWERGLTFPDASQIPLIEKAYGFKYDQLNFLPNKNA